MNILFYLFTLIKRCQEKIFFTNVSVALCPYNEKSIVLEVFFYCVLQKREKHRFGMIRVINDGKIILGRGKATTEFNKVLILDEIDRKSIKLLFIFINKYLNVFALMLINKLLF